MKENIESSVIIVPIDEQFSIVFCHIPDGYKPYSFKIEGHRSMPLGKLLSFNRIGKIAHWRKNGENLVKIYSSLLEKAGFNLDKYPNPMAYVIQFRQQQI
jgi:hypothetical protein